MPETQWSMLLVGGVCGVDGQYDFSRPVLFSTAGQCMVQAAPEDWTTMWVHAPEEAHGDAHRCVLTEEAGFSSRLAAAGLPQDGYVLVCAYPIPTAANSVYEQLRRVQERKEHRVTVIRSQRRLAAAAFSAELLHSLLLRQPQSLEQLVSLAENRRCTVSEFPCSDPAVCSAQTAYQAQRILCEQIAQKQMQRGVILFDPKSTWIAPDAQIGSGTTVLPGTMIYPGCTIGSGCTIGPNSVLKRASIGDRTTVNASQVLESTVGSAVSIGPFAYIRPGCTVGDRVKIGDFVEVKNSTIGSDTSASHLTYIGDADVGERVNFGCGTVVVNYDGYQKFRTVIGDDCFLGCNTNLVAPVSVGDRAFTAAGSTVTESVPDGALAIARARQINKPEWNEQRRSDHSDHK